MKKIFKFAMMAIAMMAVTTAFVSCGDDSNDPTPTPTVNTYDVNFYAVVGTEQLAYYDINFALDINGTTKTVKISDMTDVTSDSKIQSLIDNVEFLAKQSLDKMPAYKIYSYSCGKCKTGTTLKQTSAPTTVKSDHPTTGQFNVLLTTKFGFIADGVFVKPLTEHPLFQAGVAANDEALIKSYADKLQAVTAQYTIE